jgi:Type II secretion system (T2SS), protein E, N-terminal domain
LLISRGLVSELELRRALTVQESVGGHLKLGSILMIGGVVSEHRLLRVLMDLHGVPAVSWRSLSEAPEKTVKLLPLADAFRWNAVPYAVHHQVLGVAFARPTPSAVVEIGWRTGLKVFPGVAPDVRILQAQERYYGRSIVEPVRRLLAATADGSVAARVALEGILPPSRQSSETTRHEAASPPNAPSPTPPAVPRETADEASSRTQALRDHVAEALAAFDSRSRAIFASSVTRETSPGAAVQVVPASAPPASPAAAPPAAKPQRKTSLTTEDLRELLTASEPAAPKRPASRSKTGFTTGDLRELMR